MFDRDVRVGSAPIAVSPCTKVARWHPVSQPVSHKLHVEHAWAVWLGSGSGAGVHNRTQL